MEWKTNGHAGITVYHESWMEGGGTWFGQEYVDVVRQRYSDRTFNKIFEWCSGPGFIGFNLLDHGIGAGLCLSDIYEPAIVSAAETIRCLPPAYRNCVTAYATGQIQDLPLTEQFDLVVSNPPHFLECPGDDNMQRIKVDTDWAAHREFFEHIGQHLTADGVILLQENQAGSLNREQDFVRMIETNNLTITDVFDSPKFYTPDDHTQIYYIEIKSAI